ncbi:MAG: hypothetical protein HFI85_04255 [Clostridia bacterium]|jgi:hypothetical protein|nr:hypothetical protein [Clostridia bacterium]
MLKQLSKRIDEYLIKNYSMFVNHDYGSDLYLCGGLIRDMIIGKKPKDIDLFLLNNREGIFDFIEKHNLKYKLNTFGKPKILMDEKEIDFIPLKNLDEIIVYNIDGLFYNASQHKFVVKGFENALQTGRAVIVNDDLLHPNSSRFKERSAKIFGFMEELKRRGIVQEIKNDIEKGDMIFDEEDEIVNE